MLSPVTSAYGFFEENGIQDEHTGVVLRKARRGSGILSKCDILRNLRRSMLVFEVTLQQLHRQGGSCAELASSSLRQVNMRSRSPTRAVKWLEALENRGTSSGYISDVKCIYSPDSVRGPTLSLGVIQGASNLEGKVTSSPGDVWRSAQYVHTTAKPDAGATTE